MGLGIYPEASKPRCVVGPTDTVAYAKMKSDPNAVRNSEAIVNIDIKEVNLASLSYFQSAASDRNEWRFPIGNPSLEQICSVLAGALCSFQKQSTVPVISSWWVSIILPSLFRVELTLFVSALWHGTYAGYFMSFLIVPMCAAVEDIIFSMILVDPATNERPKWFRYLSVFLMNLLKILIAMCPKFLYFQKVAICSSHTKEESSLSHYIPLSIGKGIYFCAYVAWTISRKIRWSILS